MVFVRRMMTNVMVEEWDVSPFRHFLECDDWSVTGAVRVTLYMGRLESMKVGAEETHLATRKFFSKPTISLYLACGSYVSIVSCLVEYAKDPFFKYAYLRSCHPPSGRRIRPGSSARTTGP